MTSLGIAVRPIRNKPGSIAGGIDNCSGCRDVSSIGGIGGQYHMIVKDNSSIIAGCSRQHSSIHIPGISTAGCLDEVPGETTTE